MAHFVVTAGRRQPILLKPTGLGGGEGDICHVADFRGCVAKIWHDRGGAQPARRAKLEAMIRQPPEVPRGVLGLAALARTESPMLAWPTHLVEDAAGRCAGFLMPEIPLARTVALTRYMARSTLRSLPADERDLARRLQICRHLAGVVAELHRKRHYVVDLKAQNVLIYRRQGHVCLVDADSFSIAPDRPGAPRFAASAFTPEYAAPELLRNALPPAAVINDTQDRFALAALLYQILNHGFHPFQGRPNFVVDEWNIAASIRLGLYPNGLQPRREVSPAQGSSHDCWDRDTRGLFDLAFTGPPSGRPGAADWRDHFDALLSPRRRALVACAAAPRETAHRHFAGMPCPECRHAGPVAPAPVKAPAKAPATSPWRHWLGGVAGLAVVATVGLTLRTPGPQAATLAQVSLPAPTQRAPAQPARRAGHLPPRTGTARVPPGGVHEPKAAAPSSSPPRSPSRRVRQPVAGVMRPLHQSCCSAAQAPPASTKAPQLPGGSMVPSTGSRATRNTACRSACAKSRP